MAIEQKFNRGDVVRHRASSETAVIVYPLVHCVNEEHQTGYAHATGFRDTCILEFSGSYKLDAGFLKEDFVYPQDLLELLAPL